MGPGGEQRALTWGGPGSVRGSGLTGRLKPRQDALAPSTLGREVLGTGGPARPGGLLSLEEGPHCCCVSLLLRFIDLALKKELGHKRSRGKNRALGSGAFQARPRGQVTSPAVAEHSHRTTVGRPGRVAWGEGLGVAGVACGTRPADAQRTRLLARQGHQDTGTAF